MKGSVRVFGAWEGDVEAERLEEEEEEGVEKGGWESRRTASVMVGWKRPPWGEWARRWVGSVWPRLKNVVKILWGGGLGGVEEERGGRG